MEENRDESRDSAFEFDFEEEELTPPAPPPSPKPAPAARPAPEADPATEPAAPVAEPGPEPAPVAEPASEPATASEEPPDPGEPGTAAESDPSEAASIIPGDDLAAGGGDPSQALEPTERSGVEPPRDVSELRQVLTSLKVTDLLDVKLVEHLIEQNQLALADVVDFIDLARERNNTVAGEALAQARTTDREITLLNAELHNMEPVDLSEAEVEDGITQLLPGDQAAEWRVLPYSRNDLGELLVAISDPGNLTAREKVAQALPRETIKFRLTTPAELLTWIEKIYDPETTGAVSQILAEAADNQSELEGDMLIVRADAIDAPIIRFVNEIITQAKLEGASDIHIEPKEKETVIRFRVDGTLRDITTAQRRVTPQIVARIKTQSSMRTDERRIPQDGRMAMIVEGSPLDLRVVSVPTIYGEQITMRLLDPSQAMLTLEQLGMSPDNLDRFSEAIAKPHGCAFITGPTGSGKSTTLYSALTRVVTPEKKLITIEDPVEYRLQGITQIDVAQGRLVGDDQNKMTFANALRAILRSDPDTIMVGEIRDKETASIAIDASLTGHFLFSTLHTNDAMSSVIRLGQIGIPGFLIAEATEVIVAQRLIRRLCKCKVEQRVNEEEMRLANAPEWAVEEAAKGGHIIFRPNPDGCAECKGIGYKGRTGVHEVATMSEEMREAIIHEADHAELVKLAKANGMTTLREDAFGTVWAGETALEEMVRVVL